MKNTDLMPLLNMFSQRYGAYTMQKDTMKMWWDKLNKYEADHVKEAFEQLLGSYDKPFGWKAVVQVIESIHPQVNKDREEVISWRGNDTPKSDQEKRSLLTKVMTDIIRDKKEVIRTGKGAIDFEAEYAKSFVEIWGKPQAQKISGSMYKEAGRSRFLDLVDERLKV